MASKSARSYVREAVQGCCRQRTKLWRFRQAGRVAPGWPSARVPGAATAAPCAHTACTFGPPRFPGT